MTAVPSSPMTARAERLASLVQVERRARAAETVRALAFHMANDTRSLVDYRQALVWNARDHRLDACSGLAAPDAQAPFVLWIAHFCRRHATTEQAARPHAIAAGDLSAEDREDFDRFLGGGVLLWHPILDRREQLLGVLLLHRDAPLQTAEQTLLDMALDADRHAWAALEPRPRRLRPTLRRRPRRLWVAAALLVVGVAAVPVPQSVLAPAEVVARDPAVLRAPVQGVVDRILVPPNSTVTAGTPVVAMDTRELRSRLQSAHQDLAVTDAELRQARQQALGDARKAQDLAVLDARRAQAAAEVAFLQETLSRMTITAPRDGVVIYDDPSVWVGRPVTLGERILQVVAPTEAELDIRLPVSDAIDLPPGTEVRLFLNSAPTAPVPATVTRVGYRASATPDGVMAYRVRAAFSEAPDALRVGLKGTAKLYGASTPLVAYLLRRPLTALRPHLGW